MPKQKQPLVTEEEFTKLNQPNKGTGIPDDENSDMLEETLIGMEYDLEPASEEWDEDEEEDIEHNEEQKINGDEGRV